MTEQTPGDSGAPDAAPLADEPIPDEPSTGEGEQGTTSREWLNQLETMIHEISTQAAPVARQIGAKAAELAAIAAVKAGPAAQRAAELTLDYGQRFADKAQSVAVELRARDGVGAGPDTADSSPAADASTEDAPDDTDEAYTPPGA